MKTSPEDCDLLLVGGGSIIAPTSLRGVATIMFGILLERKRIALLMQVVY